MQDRSFWGWGSESGRPSRDYVEGIAGAFAARYGYELQEADPEPTVEELDLPVPRISPPDALSGICSSETYDRASHTYGKAFRDIARAVRRQFDNPPDLVAYPENENHVSALLDWCGSNDIAAIPYGGGSSVCGGTEARVGDAYAGVVSIDMGKLDRVVEIDRTSRAARIQAGVFGPALEDQLRPEGLTLRHFPQSFEFSTLGGWIATRSGGHFATLGTHIDDFVESVRMVTPTGVWESRRLPGSGAGPSPDRMAVGSEGILGIITEAWMRLQDRPTFRANVSVAFGGEDGFYKGAEAVRQLGQSGLWPSNCRLLDRNEALTTGAGTGEEAVLVLGFESADHNLDAWMARALELCSDAGGIYPHGAGKTRTDSAASREGAAGAWRNAFLSMPYIRDELVLRGGIADTFETAITWDRFQEFHAAIINAGKDACDGVCGSGSITCRFTHVYPDGPAPYFSITAPGKKDCMVEQWDEIKIAVSEAINTNGGTITHHHAVGRDHRPWYDKQRPEPFARALCAAKHELDPNGIMNPGVLVDPL